MNSPIVQIAIDTISVECARPLIEAAIAADADWIELGKPLVEFEGLNGLRSLGDLLAGRYVLIDTMIIAAPDKYVSAARDLGARNVTVTALAPPETVQATIASGKRHGIDVTVDLFNVRNPVEAATSARQWGAEYVMVHFGVDQKKNNPQGSPIDVLHDVVTAVDIPVSYATYDLDECRMAVEAGASVIVQGEPLLSASDPRAALSAFIAGAHTHS